jgi:tyrosinase
MTVLGAVVTAEGAIRWFIPDERGRLGMNVDLVLPGADAQGRVFLTWTPIQAQARLLNPAGPANVTVTLRSVGTGGRLRFATTRTHLGTATLALSLPASGAPVRFFVAGEFGRPSVALGDAVLEARGTGSQGVLGTKPVTVRVRKDAQTLTTTERDRFLAALATLNGGGTGRFRDFRDMHVQAADFEEHGNVGFLPWHRAYLLDLERELQAIDPSVTLPYWRFDRPAPSVFTRQFMGVPNAAGRLQFTAGHPFGTWRTDGALGINRTPSFVPTAAPAGLSNELQTIALGGAAPNASYANFDVMEFDPHGLAHTSFSFGFIRSKQTAARDPLFFMLHANVDRLWAKWQWIHKRTNPADPRAFAPAVPNRIGHRLADTMWPWNGVTGAPRPSTAPGGRLAPSPSTTAPGNTPRVRSMLDYQAVAGGAPLGFAYDDVPFEV